jgi:predicted acyl esterase
MVLMCCFSQHTRYNPLTMPCWRILIACAFLAHLIAAGVNAVQQPPLRTYDVQFRSNLSITTFDGFALHGDGYFPISTDEAQRFPVLIFPNSWACPQFEYILKALAFAEKGFIAVEYETRGWYLSGGDIDIAGPLDRRDISSVIDYVVDHASQWQVNTSAIAMVGISYGAGLTLEAAGFEPRLATAVSLSGWANLTQALYSHGTPNKAWTDLLEITADILGRPESIMAQMINDLMTHQNMSAVEAFAAQRSAGVNLTFMNERRLPIFISNNFLDRLFQPNYMVDFWNSLEGPKFLLLNQGMHAEAEIFGLFDIPGNYVWQKVTAWLQHFLQGIDTGILHEQPIQMAVEYQINDYIMFSQWPDLALVQQTTYYLGNRAGWHYGQLSPTAPPAPRAGPQDAIVYDEVTGIYDGLAIISDVVNEFVPTTNELLLYIEGGAMVYMGSPLESSLRLCGTPTIRLKFLPSSDLWQIYAVLYDVDLLDVGEIIADSYVTSWGSSGANTNSTPVTMTTEFRMLCHDVPAGHRLGVGVVLYNSMFTNPNKDFGVSFFYDNETFITLPINP